MDTGRKPVAIRILSWRRVTGYGLRGTCGGSTYGSHLVHDGRDGFVVPITTMKTFDSARYVYTESSTNTTATTISMPSLYYLHTTEYANLHLSSTHPLQTRLDSLPNPHLLHIRQRSPVDMAHGPIPHPHPALCCLESVLALSELVVCLLAANLVGFQEGV